MTGMFRWCNIPEADGMPVAVERLEVLLIVDPLFARRANGQTSSSWNNSNTTRQRTHFSKSVMQKRRISERNLQVRIMVSGSKTSGCQQKLFQC